MMTWLLWAGSGLKTTLVMILRTGPPTLVDVEALIWSWTFVGVLSLPVLFGTLVLGLHRFFVVVARAAVNEDGCAGVALHPTVWRSA